ncbi:ubiquitin carboxyl-terminal hydrolase [Anaeramoeba flamelloides]|uniref:Ubiquitin carboxyl-terminal hydrolase n=1 Tax=Anaeramoeba flamelloides TaxID=1746091 RepID=A0AAV7YRG4_9EUKA|nr:ubiquitin carboxyl-terminal hydrolase [Anaeramoeba flamelloides]
MNKNNTKKTLKRWVSKKKLETKQLWFIPVHSKEHWFLLIIKFNIKDMFAQIYICDSMKEYNTSFKLEIIQNLKSFIPTLQIFQKFYIISNIIEVDVIQQNNDYDCGLFLINYFNILFNTLSKIKNMESIIEYFDKLNDYNLFITRDDLFDLILNYKKTEKKNIINKKHDEIIIKDYLSPKGLVNLGSTCYINSIIQMLINIKDFTKILNQNLKPGNLLNLFQKLQSKGSKIINPLTFITHYKIFGETIELNVQKDSHEFLLSLFNHMELNLKKRIIKCPNEIHKNSTKLEANNILSLPINNSDSIYQSFENFYTQNDLDEENKYYCHYCKKYVKSKQIRKIHQVSDYLIIQLKRFTFNKNTNLVNKNMKPIQITKGFIINKFCTSKIKNNFKYTYKIIGGVVHRGTNINSGHYYSIMKTESKEWLKLDDKNVTKSSYEELKVTGQTNQQNDTVYLLVYKLKKERINKFNKSRDKNIQVNSVNNQLIPSFSAKIETKRKEINKKIALKSNNKNFNVWVMMKREYGIITRRDILIPENQTQNRGLRGNW